MVCVIALQRAALEATGRLQEDYILVLFFHTDVLSASCCAFHLLTVFTFIFHLFS